MRVAELQNFLQALIPPLHASGAKKEIVEDLDRACDGLKPFSDRSVRDFAAFLAKAEEYARTGVVPVQSKSPKTPRVTKPKVAALTLEQAKSLVESLYDQAIVETMTYDLIAAEVKKLEKLTAKDLGEVARHFELTPGKVKKASLNAIQEKISRRKATHARNQF
jgi:hypothetical protein